MICGLCAKLAVTGGLYWCNEGTMPERRNLTPEGLMAIEQGDDIDHPPPSGLSPGVRYRSLYGDRVSVRPVTCIDGMLLCVDHIPRSPKP